jgi:plastocyanin domain-containing protein
MLPVMIATLATNKKILLKKTQNGAERETEREREICIACDGSLAESKFT